MPKQVERGTGIEHMIQLARSDAKISVGPDGLDADPWLLNCRNGTVDLKTGSLLPHDRKHLLTKIAAVDYLTSAGGRITVMGSNR